MIKCVVVKGGGMEIIMENKYAGRVKMLQKLMKENDYDIYIVPSNDYHGSEYIGLHFKEREYVSGFTGSAGTLVVTRNEAALFTDGRYFIQAEKELEGSGIRLCKLGIPGNPSKNQYIRDNLREQGTIGFDGKYVSIKKAEEYERIAKKKAGKICCEKNLVDSIWENRPELSHQPAFLLDKEYSGMECREKLEKVRGMMEKDDMLVLTALDDIGWLTNLRGNDVQCNPVILAYMIVTMEKAILYCNTQAVNQKNIMDYLNENDISVREYDKIYDELPEISENYTLLMDFDKVNYELFLKAGDRAIADVVNPTTRLKAVKNQVEIENERLAHIYDGAAFVKLLYWFKKNVQSNELDEMSVADYLLEKRKQQPGFIEESFEPIVAYREHGAIVHYSATKESNKKIEENSFVLIDTGGHYLAGTTDITRTIACGKLSEEEKRNYTLVLKGHLALGNAKFMEGTTGANLDILARQFLWNEGLNYNHGTGHGVGYLLNVHEGPNNIRLSLKNGRDLSAEIKSGMISSNEPGIYIENSHGIRIENMVVCVKDMENEYGTFLKFDTLTLVPYEREAIVKEMLTENEIRLINEYHIRVYEMLEKYLDENEKEFLREIVKPL